MSYQYAFDTTRISDLPLRRPAYDTLHAAERELRDALDEWNRRALENGARVGPYESEVEDLDRMIAWGDAQLARTQATHITIKGISLGSARYAKAALVLTIRRRREDLTRKSAQGWPDAALRSLDDAIDGIERIAGLIDQEPSDVLWELIPRDDARPPPTPSPSHPEWDVIISQTQIHRRAPATFSGREFAILRSRRSAVRFLLHIRPIRFGAPARRLARHLGPSPSPHAGGVWSARRSWLPP